MTVDRGHLFRKLIAAFEATPSISEFDLARRFKLHRHTIDRAVRDATGSSFLEWRDTWRERMASELLLSAPELSLKEIGVKVGLSGSAALRRFFKRRRGLTPSQFRS